MRMKETMRKIVNRRKREEQIDTFHVAVLPAAKQADLALNGF